MKKILPLLVVSIFILSVIGVVAIPEKVSLNKQDWVLEIDVECGFLGYEVSITNIGNESVSGNFILNITTDAWIMILGRRLELPIDSYLYWDAGEEISLPYRPVLGFGPGTINVSGVFTHETDGEYPFEKETVGFVLLFYVFGGFELILIP